jgi:hypothetical protein
MKKFFMFSLLIAFCCAFTTPEPIVPKDDLTCSNSYTWTTPNYPLVSQTSSTWNWYVDAYPAWNLACVAPVTAESDLNASFKFKFENTGYSTIRFRENGGAWTTLTTGQSALIVKTAAAPGCSAGYAPIQFTINVERTVCINDPATGFGDTRFNLSVFTLNNGHTWVYHPPGGMGNCSSPSSTTRVFAHSHSGC